MKPRIHILLLSLIIAVCSLSVAHSQQTTLQHTYPKGWSMVSVPMLPTDPSPSVVFSAVPPPLRLYDYKNGFEVEAGESGFTSIVPGRGYRLLLGQATTISVTGTLLSDTVSYHIPISPGWNVIGEPWRATINWEDARIAVSDGIDTLPLSQASSIPYEWIEGTVFRINSSNEMYIALLANNEPPDQLSPWEGYLLYSKIIGELIILPPPSGDTVPPTVEITAPVNGTKVSVVTDILGTVHDDNLVSWTLEYAPAETGQYTVLATGTNPADNSFLSKLDPTLLLNGMVNLRLSAVDLAGNYNEDIKTVLIEGENKLGVMRISFVDLEVPVAGIPITIKRTYDSRTRNLLRDFGYGWTLEVGVGGKYTNNRKPGDGWEFQMPDVHTLPCTQINILKYHATEIRFSDREFYRFALQLVSAGEEWGGCWAQASFAQIGGIPGASLHIEGHTNVFWQNYTDYIYDPTDPNATIYEPQEVTLTTMDGRQYKMHIQKGLESMKDLNGNELTINESGVTHNNSGQSINFLRDSSHRIYSITDPMNKSIAYTYTTSGDLQKVTNRDNKSIQFGYDSNHFLTSIIDGDNNTPLTMEYDGDGRVIALIDADGHRTQLVHDPEVTNGSTITNRLGKPTQYKYDANGHLSDIIDAYNNTTHYVNDERGNVLSETDPLGHVTSNTYDSNDNLLTVADPLNHVTSYKYNNHGSVTKVTDPNGNATQNTYDPVTNNLMIVRDAMGNETHYDYYSNGNLKTEKNALNYITTHEYDSYGYLNKTIDPLGNVREYENDKNGHQLSSTVYRTVNGALEPERSTSTYNNSGQLLTQTDALGHATTYTYDNNGRRATVTDALGQTTTNQYNSRGYIEKVIYPDGTPGNPDDNPYELYGYDLEGRRASHVDRAGVLWTWDYDDLGRLWKIWYPPKDANSQPAFTENHYDDAGRLDWAKNERGYVTSYQYDDAGRRIKVIDALGHVTQSEYYSNRNLWKVTDPRGNITEYQYDANNRRTKIIEPTGYNRQTVFDKLGRRVAEIDEEGMTTHYGYDALSRLTNVTDALGYATGYEYDEVGNQLTQTDANNHITSFTYDALGQRLTRKLPLYQIETKVYDALGNLQSKTDFNGHAITYEYNVDNRLNRKLYHPDNSEVLFTYTPTGQRQTVTDSNGIWNYEYYPRGWLKKYTYPNGWHIDYDYDDSGNRITLTTSTVGPSQMTSYAFDELNRLQEVQDPQGLTTHYTYDANSNKQSMGYPNGIIANYEYDGMNRLYKLKNLRPDGSPISAYEYELRPSGNKSKVMENDGRIVEWTYDDVYRLTLEKITNPDGSIKTFSYQYDPIGNRLMKTENSAIINYSYDDNDRMLAENTNSYIWDNNGNILSKTDSSGTITYSWDYENRLIQAQTPIELIHYAYDLDGIRIQSNANGSLINYFVDSNRDYAQVLEERDGSDNVIAAYEYGDDLINQNRSNALSYYHYDFIGSTRNLTNVSGNIINTYAYEAFGNLIQQTGSIFNNYLFTGEQYDSNSNLYYLRARYYSQSAGRFISMDSAKCCSSKKYIYADNNPLRYVDYGGNQEEFNLPIAHLDEINLSGFGANFRTGDPEYFYFPHPIAEGCKKMYPIWIEMMEDAATRACREAPQRLRRLGQFKLASDIQDRCRSTIYVNCKDPNNQCGWVWSYFNGKNVYSQDNPIHVCQSAFSLPYPKYSLITHMWCLTNLMFHEMLHTVDRSRGEDWAYLYANLVFDPECTAKWWGSEWWVCTIESGFIDYNAPTVER